MATFEGLNVEKLGVKFISMGYSDGSNVFDIARVQHGMITQMKENAIPFMICPLNQFGGLGFIKVKFGGSLGSHPCGFYGFLFHSPNIHGISKAMWCAFRKWKQVVHKCEDKMDKYVDFSETCHGAILTSNCKNAHWCT